MIEISETMYNDIAKDIYSIIGPLETLRPCTCQFGHTLLSALRGHLVKCSCNNSSLATLEKALADKDCDNKLVNGKTYKSIYLLVRFVLDLMIRSKLNGI